MNREQRDYLRKQIDARIRERLGNLSRKGPRQQGHVPKRPRKVKA